MQAYHDKEWGVPERDGRALWEKLVLDGFQAGLAWITILRKRETIRAAFAGFDPAASRASARPTSRACSPTPASSAPAPRSRRRSPAPASTATWPTAARTSPPSVWSFTGGETLRGDGAQPSGEDALSETVSKELKRRGFKFVGPTIVYAWMQAVGIVNDHAAGCFRRDGV